MRHITCSLKPSFAHENCLIFAGIGSGLHCYQFLIYTLCLRINFHTWSFWVLILAAGGPYWVLISQKKWVLIGSLSQSLGVFISFRGSAIGGGEVASYKGGGECPILAMGW